MRAAIRPCVCRMGGEMCPLYYVLHSIHIVMIVEQIPDDFGHSLVFHSYPNTMTSKNTTAPVLASSLRPITSAAAVIKGALAHHAGTDAKRDRLRRFDKLHLQERLDLLKQAGVALSNIAFPRDFDRATLGGLEEDFNEGQKLPDDYVFIVGFTAATALSKFCHQ
jgi:hypothetical protein